MAITDPNFHWPTKDDYEIAMDNMRNTMLDPTLSRGKVANQHSHILHIGSANHTSLYRIADQHGQNWMIRCFCESDTPASLGENNDDKTLSVEIAERYKYISRFCEMHLSDVPALLPIVYVEKGIRVDYFERDVIGQILNHKKQEELPFIKMPFVRGQSLGYFIASKCSKYKDAQDRSTLSLLADSWLELIRSLESINMAHGDLDLTNVIVDSWQPGSRPQLKLIDYDNVWIPELAHYPQNEQGHEAFQHPDYFWSRSRPYNAEMDRFSALVIYISIKALAVDPDLYEEGGADENNRLLFAPADYKAEKENRSQSRIDLLLSRNIPGLEPYLKALRVSLSLRTTQMPPSLDAIARGETAPPLARKSVKPQRIDDPVESQVNEERMKPIEIWEIQHVDWENAVYFKDNDRHFSEDNISPVNQPVRPSSEWSPRPRAVPLSEDNILPANQPVRPSSEWPPRPRPVPQQVPASLPPEPPAQRREEQPLSRPASSPSWPQTARTEASLVPTRRMEERQVSDLSNINASAVTVHNNPYEDKGTHFNVDAPQKSSTLYTWIGCFALIVVVIVVAILISLLVHAFQTPQHTGHTLLKQLVQTLAS